MAIRKLILCALFIFCSYASVRILIGVFPTTTGKTQYHQFTRSGGGAAVLINQLVAVSPILRLSDKNTKANENVVVMVENDGSMGIGTTTVGKLSDAGEGITLYSTLTNSTNSPTVSIITVHDEIKGMSASQAMDDEFLRLSSDWGISPFSKSFIDLSGYTNAASFD